MRAHSSSQRSQGERWATEPRGRGGIGSSSMPPMLEVRTRRSGSSAGVVAGGGADGAVAVPGGVAADGRGAAGGGGSWGSRGGRRERGGPWGRGASRGRGRSTGSRGGRGAPGGRAARAVRGQEHARARIDALVADHPGGGWQRSPGGWMPGTTKGSGVQRVVRGGGRVVRARIVADRCARVTGSGPAAVARSRARRAPRRPSGRTVGGSGRSSAGTRRDRRSEGVTVPAPAAAVRGPCGASESLERSSQAIPPPRWAPDRPTEARIPRPRGIGGRRRSVLLTDRQGRAPHASG